MPKKTKPSDKKFSVSKFYDIEAEEEEDNFSRESVGEEKDTINENLRRYQEEIDKIRERNEAKARLMMENFERIAVEEHSSEEELRKVDQYAGDEELEEEPELDRKKAAGLIGRLPTFTDANIWLIRVKYGKEFLVLQELARKLLKYPHTNRMPIHNIYCMKRGGGFIYIEAFREKEVEVLCKNVSFIISRNSFSKVPLEEVSRTFTYSKPLLAGKVGDFVRIKNGIYGGDLAQICGVNYSQGAYEIKLIPRLNLNTLKRIRNSKGFNTNRKALNKRLNNSNDFRMDKKLLRDDEIRESGIDYKIRTSQIDGLTYIFIGNKKFRNGFLYSKVKSQRVELLDKTPSIEEQKPFLGEDIEDIIALGKNHLPNDYPTPNYNGNNVNKKGEMIGEMESNKNYSNAKDAKMEAVKATIGDRVVVIEGELQNFEAFVQKLDKGTAYISTSSSPEIFEVPLRSLKRLFKEGDEVVIVSGLRKGVSGLVVSFMESGKLRIFTGKESIEDFEGNVRILNTKESLEKGENGNTNPLNALKNFNAFDREDSKIKNDGSSTGKEKFEKTAIYGIGQILTSEDGTICIVLGKTEAGEELVLSSNNERTVFRQGELKPLGNLQRQISFDVDGYKIRPKNIIRCCFGELEGLIGTVLYVHNDKLFVQSFNKTFSNQSGKSGSASFSRFSNSSRNFSNRGGRKRFGRKDPDRYFVLQSDHVRVDREEPSRNFDRSNIFFNDVKDYNVNSKSNQEVIKLSSDVNQRTLLNGSNSYRKEGTKIGTGEHAFFNFMRTPSGRIIAPEKFMVGKQVKVTRGPYKSSIGVIRYANREGAVVELLSDGNRINIDLASFNVISR